jgi:hypothetical protein
MASASQVSARRHSRARRWAIVRTKLRTGRLLPDLAREFDGVRSPEEIRAYADAILAGYQDSPTGSARAVGTPPRVRVPAATGLDVMH